MFRIRLILLQGEQEWLGAEATALHKIIANSSECERIRVRLHGIEKRLGEIVCEVQGVKELVQTLHPEDFAFLDSL